MTSNQCEELKNKNDALKTYNEELKTQVDMSCVKAVKKAQESQKTAEEHLKFFAGYIDDLSKKQIAEADAKYYKASKVLQDKKRITFITQCLVLLCCFVGNPVLFNNLWKFFTLPFVWFWKMIPALTAWIISPSYWNIFGNKELHYSVPAVSWIVRVISIVAVIFMVLLICRGIKVFIRQCRKDWCSINTRAAYCTLIIICIFEKPLFGCIHCNLILLFFILQLLGMLIIKILDRHFKNNRIYYNNWLYLKTL